MTNQFDVLVVGGGPGGISAATKLALKGKKVCVINEGPLMGYGIDGAFRSKAGFEITREFLHAEFRKHVFGDLPALRVESLQRGIAESAASLTAMLVKRLARLNITLIKAHATFVDANTVKAEKQLYKAENIIIATGTRPRVLPGMQIDGRRVITSDEVNSLDFTPESILILGGGVIGCEFASMFSAVGSKVHLVDSQPVIMGSEDPDLSQYIAQAFSARGITVISSSRYESLQVNPQDVSVKLSTGNINTDVVLLAVGRVANTQGLNLEAAGIGVNKNGYIPVDSNSKTSVEHIYAVGDIGLRDVPTDLALVHVAEAEGRNAASHILGTSFQQNMDHIPYIIFTVPMMAGAGLTETLAREKYGDVRVGKYPYARNHRAHAIQPPVGFVKLIVGPPGDDRILGVRVVGAESDGIVSAASIIIERNLPYTYLLESIFPHPSLLESLQGAAHIIAGDMLKYEEGEEVSPADIEMR